MSDFRTVTDTVSVAPQISTADLDAAAEAGFTLIINNRPDGETADQPANADLQTYAESKGLKWLYIPIVSGDLTVESVEQSAAAFAQGEKTLAFCRSGTRSCTLWGLSEALRGARDSADIMTKAQTAGYDLTGLAPTLEHLHTNAS